MEELSEIKESLAKEKGYDNWTECINDHPNCMVETLMDIVAIRYHQAKLKELESKTFSQSEMLKISQDWTNERSVGDTKQDADCCYYFLQGLRKMNTLK